MEFRENSFQVLRPSLQKGEECFCNARFIYREGWIVSTRKRYRYRFNGSNCFCLFSSDCEFLSSGKFSCNSIWFDDRLFHLSDKDVYYSSNYLLFVTMCIMEDLKELHYDEHFLRFPTGCNSSIVQIK